jgi:5-methylthioadenosine/S-adenosylhomocysteine deaminase
MVIHLAETAGEVATIQERYGRTPVEHLEALGVLAPNVLACHCVALTEHDIQLLKRHDVKVSHNPESNMKLASGIAPVPQLLEAGVCVGLGTDGAASNNNLDLFLEMDTAAKLHKVHRLDPIGRRERCWYGDHRGRRAWARCPDRSIEPGNDLILTTPETAPHPHVPRRLPTGVRRPGGDIATVIVDGRVLMEDRRLLTFDVEQAMDEVIGIGADMHARLTARSSKGQ